MRYTHECRTDPEAKLYRKSAGGAYRICHMAHVLMENRNGLEGKRRPAEALPIAAAFETGRRESDPSARAQASKASAAAGSAGTEMLVSMVPWKWAPSLMTMRGVRISPTRLHWLHSSTRWLA